MYNVLICKSGDHEHLSWLAIYAGSCDMSHWKIEIDNPMGGFSMMQLQLHFSRVWESESALKLMGTRSFFKSKEKSIAVIWFMLQSINSWILQHTTFRLPFVNAKFRGVALLFLFKWLWRLGEKHSFHVMCHISLTEKHPAKKELIWRKLSMILAKRRGKVWGCPKDSERQRRQLQLVSRRQIWFV